MATLLKRIRTFQILLLSLIIIVASGYNNFTYSQCPTLITSLSNGKKLDITGVSYTNVTDIDISGSVTITNKTLDGSNRTTPDEANNAFDPCFDTGNECTLTFTHDGGTSVCVYDATGARANPLPIELMHFGVNQTNNKVISQWQTATETNNDFFTLERSIDLQTWDVIKTIQGAGNSNSTLEYKTIDENPLQGMNYYQLRQTDYDGKFTYSKIVSVKFSKKNIKDNSINVFPNPTNGQTIIVALNNIEGNYALKVFNILGVIVYSETKNIQAEAASTVTKQLDFSSQLPAGVYKVIISSENLNYSQNFIVN